MTLFLLSKEKKDNNENILFQNLYVFFDEDFCLITSLAYYKFMQMATQWHNKKRLNSGINTRYTNFQGLFNKMVQRQHILNNYKLTPFFVPSLYIFMCH